MSGPLMQALATLRDVEGIRGSFLLNEQGALVARDLPGIFADQVLDRAGGRLARLIEVFAAAEEQLDACMLRYEEHRLYVRKSANGILCVITDVAVNAPALRMASTLVMRRVASDLESGRASSPELGRAPASSDPQGDGSRLSAPPPPAGFSQPPPGPSSSVPPARRPLPRGGVPGATPAPPSASRQGLVYRGHKVT